jgi:hypothetical protein
MALCSQGNLSKWYRTLVSLVQQGLATVDKIHTLPEKHPSSSSSMYSLQDQEMLKEIQSLHYTIDWKVLVLLLALDKVIQMKKP